MEPWNSALRYWNAPKGPGTALALLERPGGALEQRFALLERPKGAMEQRFALLERPGGAYALQSSSFFQRS